MDTSTPSGEMMANVLASFAQFERRLISQRTKDGLAVKRNQGVRLGRAPVDEALRRRIKALRTRGRSYAAIAALLNAEGVPTPQGGQRWYASSIRSILTR